MLLTNLFSYIPIHSSQRRSHCLLLRSSPQSSLRFNYVDSKGRTVLKFYFHWSCHFLYDVQPNPLYSSPTYQHCFVLQSSIIHTDSVFLKTYFLFQPFRLSCSRFTIAFICQQTSRNTYPGIPSPGPSTPVPVDNNVPEVNPDDADDIPVIIADLQADEEFPSSLSTSTIFKMAPKMQAFIIFSFVFTSLFC